MGLIYTIIMDDQKEQTYDGTNLHFNLRFGDNIGPNPTFIANSEDNGLQIGGLNMSIDFDKNIFLFIQLDIDLVMIWIYYLDKSEIGPKEAGEIVAQKSPAKSLRFAGRYSSNILLVYGGMSSWKVNEHGDPEIEDPPNVIKDGPDLQQEYASPEDIYAEQGVGFDSE